MRTEDRARACCSRALRGWRTHLGASTDVANADGWEARHRKLESRMGNKAEGRNRGFRRAADPIPGCKGNGKPDGRRGLRNERCDFPCRACGFANCPHFAHCDSARDYASNARGGRRGGAMNAHGSRLALVVGIKRMPM